MQKAERASLARWLMPVILGIRKLRQEESKLKAVWLREYVQGQPRQVSEV